MKRMAEYVRMRVDSCGYVKGRNEKSRPIQGRPFPKLRLRLLGISFLSPDLPSREAMRSITFSLVKTKRKARNANFNTVFIAVSRFISSEAKVSSGGSAVAAMWFYVRMRAVLAWRRAVFVWFFSESGEKPPHRVEHIPGRRRNKGIASPTPAALSLRCC